VLSQGHLDDLKRSGLSDTTIHASNCYSASREQVRTILGFDIGCGGLVFPYPDTDGFERVKADTPPIIDGKPARYLSPRKIANRLYVPPMLDRRLLEDAKTTLLIGEGEKKVLAAVQEGACCIGLAGVWAWRTWTSSVEKGRTHVSRHLKELEEIAWKGREVLICFDSDIRRNPHVMQAERRFAALLTSWGAKVFGVRLPDGHQDKCGLDDFLLKHSLEQVYELPRVDYTRGQVISASDLLAISFENTPDLIGEGVLPQGGGLILSGESGAGKTMLVLDWSVRLATGMPILGLHVPKPHRVHIQQAENPLMLMQFRLRRMLEGLGLSDVPGLSFGDPTLSFDLGLKRDRDRLCESLARVEPEIVVLDPLSSFLGACNENDNLAIRARLDALTVISRDLGCGFLIVDHYGKPVEGADPAHRTRGASSKRDWADTLVGMTVRRHETRCLRQLSFHKIRHGPDQPSILIERNESFLHCVVDEDSTCPPYLVRKVLIEEFGGSVEGQKPLREALMKETDCGKRTAETAIRRAVADGKIDENDRGRGKAKRYAAV